MHKMLLGTIAFVMVVLLASPMLAGAQTSDPVSLVTRLTTALNSYDEAGVGALLTDDAVLFYTPQAVNVGGATYEGRANILETIVPELRRDAVHYEVIEMPHVQGDKVSWLWRETSEVLRANRVDYLEYNVDGMIQGDRFQSIGFTFTEESVAKVQTATNAQEPAGMPRTGQRETISYNWLLITGILLTLGGAGIIQYSRRTS